MCDVFNPSGAMEELVLGPDGENEMLRLSIKAEVVIPRIWHLRLFDNDYHPKRNVVLADLTEVTWSGYAPVPMDPADWSDMVQLAGKAISYWGVGPTQFTPASGAHDVYGYFITFNDGAKLLWCQRFEFAPINTTPSTPLPVWPVITGRSESEPPP